MELKAATRLNYPRFTPVRPGETSKYLFALGSKNALQDALDHFSIRGLAKLAKYPGTSTYFQAATGVDQEKFAKALLTQCEQSRDESTATTRVIAVLGYRMLDGHASAWDLFSVVFTDSTVWLIPRHFARKLDL